ncbi:MAG: PSD1 domain-containing protein [Planctomycetia bacterium]|nr:PSD1 domain-containing protein [Planctomycetia bacterium]
MSCLLAAGVWVAIAATAAAEPTAAAPPGAPITFEKQVAPILTARCGKCHAGDKIEAGLDVRRRAALVAGGDSGTALVPGKPDESLLIKRVDAGEMPPDGETGLDEKEKQVLRQWIAAGAPAEKAEEPPLDAPAARVSEEDRNFWAFRPPVRPEMPTVRGQDRVRTPIDAFLLAKLEEQGLSFNCDAPKAVLLRRLCFDLHGLPPTPEQLDEFLADSRPDAYEQLVERLLAAPRYGERWARHWLDVAGYADSDGYLDADHPRPEAWRYRDWVIRALNDDVPYDRFVCQQLAGDELSDWRRAEKLTPRMIDDLTATGFLRTASDGTYTGYIEKTECYQVISDTIQIVSSAFLGLTMQCARCHAHKYDPISQRDYYALQAIFGAALDPERWQSSEVRTIPMASEAQQAAVKDHNQPIDERVAALQKYKAQWTERYQKEAVAEILARSENAAAPEAAADPKLPETLREALATNPKKRSTEQQKLAERYAPNVSLGEEGLSKRSPEYAEELKKVKAAVAAESALRQPIVALRGLVDVDDAPRETHVLIRGDFEKPGAKVEPGVPAVLTAPDAKFAAQPGYKTTGRRRALAGWLTAPDHPLLARTQVNRIWQRHFGRGIVPTVANLGHSGSQPSHPELLDWLATELMRQAWSQKAIHRVIVLSTAYRQSSDYNERKAAADPDGILLSAWRPSRVDGETLRDAALAVAGKLNLEMYGSPTPVDRRTDSSVVTADDAAGNRRSIYLMVRRSQHLTMFDLFDTPVMEINCPQRNESIVPLQALALLNGPFAESAAKALGERVVREGGATVDGQCDTAYRLLFARLPTAAERAAIAKLLEACAAEALGEAGAAATAEQKSAAAAAAWNQAALVLLNSNEFLYVD